MTKTKNGATVKYNYVSKNQEAPTNINTDLLNYLFNRILRNLSEIKTDLKTLI